MNNYKELVSALREEAEAVKAVERDIPTIKLFLPCTSNHIAEAADAIEQQKAAIERLEAENRAKEQYIAETIGKVIKERDEWKTLGSLANKRAEDYREMRRQRDKAIKERDAAIADFETFAKTAFDKPFACDFCEHKDGEFCKWKKQNRFDKDGCFGRCFEWRGVQEVEHEAD